MEFGVLELGLKNQQLSSVKCFLRIQVEALRILRNECLQQIQSHPHLYIGNNDEAQIHKLTEPYARHLQQWLQVFDKLALVINCTCRDHSSQLNRSFRFGLAVSVITLEIASSLICLLDFDDQSARNDDQEEAEDDAEEEEEDHDMQNEENVSKARASASPLAACDLSFLANLQEILGGIKQQVLPSSTTSNALLSNEASSSQYDVSLLLPPPLVSSSSSSSPSPQGVIVESLHHLLSTSHADTGTAFSLLQAQAALWNKFATDRAKFKWQNVTLIIFNEFIQYIREHPVPSDTRIANCLLYKINLQLYPTLTVLIEETFDSELRKNIASWIKYLQISTDVTSEYEKCEHFMQIAHNLYGSCLRLNLSIMKSMTSYVNILQVALALNSHELHDKHLRATPGSLIYNSLIKLNEVPRLLTYLTERHSLLDEQVVHQLIQMLLFNNKSSIYLPESMSNQLLNIFCTHLTSRETNIAINDLTSGFVKCHKNFFDYNINSGQLVTFAMDNNLYELLLLILQKNKHVKSSGECDKINFIAHFIGNENISTFDAIVAVEKLLKFNCHTKEPISNTVAASYLFFYGEQVTRDAQVKDLMKIACEKVNKFFPLVASCIDDETRRYFGMDSCNKLDMRCNTSSLYYLLRRSLPVDMGKVFTWQRCNIYRAASSPLPTFGNNTIDDDAIGIKCKLDSLYFISQGRPCQGFCMINDTLQDACPEEKSFSLNIVAQKASLIAYKNCKKIDIANGAILFQEVTLNDSTNLRLHMAIGNFVSKYAGDFLGFKSHQQEIELGILLKSATSTAPQAETAKSTCNATPAAAAAGETDGAQERAVIKLLQLVLTAFERKYHQMRHISVDECLQWNLVVNFCNYHRIPLPNDFLIKCARNDDWLLFTICCQMYDYPKEYVIKYLSHFNNGCIADHLEKAFLSSACVSEKDESPLAILKSNRLMGRPVSSVNSRKNLYFKIGVKQRSPGSQFTGQSPSLSSHLMPSSPASSVSNETVMSSSMHGDDTRSVMSDGMETASTVADNVSIVSRPLSDNNQESGPPSDWIHPPTDLYNLILACQRKTHQSTQVSLLVSGVTFSNHVVILLASSIPHTHLQWPFTTFDVACFWIAAATQSSLVNKIRHYSSWTVENLIELLTSSLKNIYHLNTLSTACKLFNLQNSPLYQLILFLIEFIFEKEHHKCIDLLKAFQQNYWKFNKINSEKNTLVTESKNPFFSNDGIAAITVTLLKCALESLDNFYEIRLLLRHLDFARIQSMFTDDSVEMINFNKLNRMAQVISDTDVDLPISLLINCSDKSDEYVKSVLNVTFKLQEKRYFTEANQLASIATLSTQVVTLNEWKVKATVKRESFEFWQECSANLSRILVDPQLLYDFYDSFLRDINCLLCQAVVQLEMLKTAIDDNNVITDAQWYNLEVTFYRTLMQIEFSQHRQGASYTLLWNQIKQALALMKDKDKCNSIADDKDSGDFELVESPIQVSNELLDQIVSKLVTGDLHIAKRFASIYSYHCKDLDLLIYIDCLAKGEPLTQIELNYLNSLEIKLPECELSEQFNFQQRLTLMETLSRHINYCTSVASKRLLSFKICNVLSDVSYESIIVSQDDLEILDNLIDLSCGSDVSTTDIVSLAKEFICMNEIEDAQVAKIILRKLIKSLTSMKGEGRNYFINDNVATDEQQSQTNSPTSGNFFLAQLRLLSNSSVLGQQILGYLRNGVLDDHPLSVTVEFYIKAHDCFSMSTDIEGISLVLRNVKCLVIQQLSPNEDYNSMIRILTGIGRYSEMTYIFDILKEHQKFELLLGRSIEKVPQLRIALLDSLKGDKEMYPMVALNFSMHREIAEMLHDEVMKILKGITVRKKSLNVNNVRDLLERSLADLVDAAESFDKAYCYNQAKKCSLMAELVALELHHINSGIEFLNLSNKSVAQLIANHPNCSEAVIIADAYNHHQSWPNALYNRVIKNSDWSYFREFTQHFGPPNDTLLDEIVTKCLQEYTVISKGSNVEIALQKILSSSHDVEVYFKLCAKAGINAKIPSHSASDKESDAFFLDCMFFNSHVN